MLCLATFATKVGAEVRTFDAPMSRGAALAYCSADGSVCGADLARDWCIDQGFERASNWTISDNAGVISSPSVRANNRQGFRSITCAREGNAFRSPRLGTLTRTTVIAPDRRAAEVAIAPVDYQITVPGCTQREPGVFLCDNVHDYQMCRSLHQAGQVFGCRAGVAFASGFAKPVFVDSEQLAMNVQSDAVATVHMDRRGRGKVRGEVEYEVALPVPQTSDDMLCLQRDRYVYFPTGPMGGMSEIEAPGGCGEPVRGQFEPHEDDLLRAWDQCAAENAWGHSIEQPIEVLVAALYHFVDADIAGTLKGAQAPPNILAPYTTVRARMRINCEQ